MRAYLLACVLALSTTACLEEDTAATDEAPAAAADGEPAQAGPNEPSFQVAQAPAGPPQVSGQIDWEAARADRAKASTNTPNVQIQNTTGNQAPPPVPMLLPSGIVQAQNARPPAVVTTGDGYFATYQLPRYDAIVNGTATATVTGGQAGDKAAMKFDVTEGGAQLAFSRYGADYLIEFECRQIDGGETCLTEDEAKAFADSLFVAQTQ